jgi:hypothetical protein
LIDFQNRVPGRARAAEGIENKVAGIRGNLEHALKQARGLRSSIKRRAAGEQAKQFLARFVSVANIFVRPPRPRNNAFNLGEVADNIRLRVAALAEVNLSFTSKALERRL